MAEMVNFANWMGENVVRLANNANVGTYNCGEHTTGHVRFLSQPLEGDIVTITVGSLTTRFEFDTDTVLSSTEHVAVTIGANLTTTVTNFVAAIGRSIGLVLAAFQSATQTGVADVIVTHDDTALAFLESTAGARIATQSNGETREGAAVYLYAVRRTVTAEDIARGIVRFHTPFSSVINYLYNMTSSATLGTAVPYAGTISENGGVLEFTSSVLAIGNVIRFWALGALGDKEDQDDTNPGALTKSGDFLP